MKTDVREFEQALERGEARAALAAYAGPFLDGFHLSDAPEFERWVDAERERLARAYARALERMAEEASDAADVKGAVDWWRRLAAQEPYNARVTLRVMEALEVAGDRAGAIQHARVHCMLLEQEFGAAPDPDVLALAERLRSGSARGRDGAGDEPPPHRLVADPAPPRPRADAQQASGPRLDPRPQSGVLGRLRFGWSLAGLVGALVLGSATALALVWRIPERNSRVVVGPESAAAFPKSLAVLPCANLSGDPEQEYFSDGLTEELISVLAQVRALRVVARTSVFAFKGENRDIREIGRTLDVGTVLECSVRSEGERVRVAAQLISAADGLHLWSQIYERAGTDIFAIQSELAVHIASALRAELTPAERIRLARRPTGNPEAHMLYLKGRHFWNQRTAGGFERAIESFEGAIRADPQYAAAHAGLAATYSLQGLHGYLIPRDARVRTRAAALKAVALDGESAEARTALAAYLNVYEWDAEASEREYLRALDLDPNYGTARHLYGNLLLAMGRIDEAVTQKRKAVQLDPLAPQLSNSLGFAFIQAGRHQAAGEAFRAALEVDSTFWAAYVGTGDLHAALGRFEEAVRAYRRADELAGTTTQARVGLARALALSGQRAEARAILDEMRAEADRSELYPPAVASVFLALDDGGGVENALNWLERSYQQKHPQLRFLTRGDGFRRLEGQPRYVDLLHRVGLTP